MNFFVVNCESDANSRHLIVTLLVDDVCESDESRHGAAAGCVGVCAVNTGARPGVDVQLAPDHEVIADMGRNLAGQRSVVIDFEEDPVG